MVKTFAEWKAACAKEHDKLHDVIDYLTPDGKERMRVFGLMINLAGYCETAKELLEWIETKDGMFKEDIRYLLSPYASRPVNALKRIAEQEAKSELEPKEDPKPAFYVTYRIDARYVAEVHADSIEEAKKEAQYEWESADFGVAQDIEGEPVTVEGENGDIVWEK